jgi:methylenetetrahydrofolate reductase (NADPH)
MNAVTWAVFPGQEIVQSTIIEEISFLAWKVNLIHCWAPHAMECCLLLRLRTMQEEAFEIWTEWSRLYPLRSASRQLLQQISEESWLVSLIHHDYKDTEALWRFLMQE